MPKDFLYAIRKKIINLKGKKMIIACGFFIILYVLTFYLYNEHRKYNILYKNKMIELKNFAKENIRENTSFKESMFENFDYIELWRYFIDIFYDMEQTKPFSNRINFDERFNNSIVLKKLKPLREIYECLKTKNGIMVGFLFLTFVFFLIVIYGTITFFNFSCFAIFYLCFYFIIVSLFSKKIAKQIREISLSKSDFCFNYSLFLICLFICPILFLNVIFDVSKTNQKIYSVFNSLNFIKHNKIVSSYKEEADKL